MLSSFLGAMQIVLASLAVQSSQILMLCHDWVMLICKGVPNMCGAVDDSCKQKYYMYVYTEVNDSASKTHHVTYSMFT